MSTRRPGPTGEDDLLAGVLRAAAAPAHPGELAGEEAAVAAFRAATARVETAPARPSALRRVVAKALTVKAAVAVAVVGSAGVVLAASGGVLPTPWSTVPPVEQTQTPTSTAPAVPGPSARTGPHATTPAPAVVDLCEAYAESDGKHRADPKFGPLIDAAGGADGVTEYCATHAPPSSRNSSKNEPGNGNPTKSPNTEKSEKNKPDKPTGAKPVVPPGETVKPGKNPPGEANTPPNTPANTPANTPGNTPAKPPAQPESANPPGQPPQGATPSRGRG